MKPIYIVLSVVAAVAVLVMSVFAYANNTAVGYEETIVNSFSGIQVQKQKQHDLILQLVQVVEQYSKHEAGIQSKAIEAHAAAESGNVAGAAMAINAVAEAYPDLKANETYIQLMTEMSISEKAVAQYRITYNTNVEDYKKFVRRWPFGSILHTMGYQVQSFSYLQFDNNDLPANLFGN